MYLFTHKTKVSLFLTIVLFLTVNLQKTFGQKVKSVNENQLYNTAYIKPMVHAGLGAGDYSFTALGVSIFHQISRSISGGLSVHYFGENGKGSSRLIKWQKIPMTLETHIDLKKYQDNKSAVFLRLGAGYSFTLNGSFYDAGDAVQKKVTNGWAFNPGLGYRINLLKNTGLTFDMSYSLIADNTENDEGIRLSRNKWSHILFRTSVFF